MPAHIDNIVDAATYPIVAFVVARGTVPGEL
jgi:hypothetical protein